MSILSYECNIFLDVNRMCLKFILYAVELMSTGVHQPYGTTIVSNNIFGTVSK